jgi:hypothetical protein
MRINVNSPDAPATLPHSCANCGAPCSGAVQVFLHIADNPPEGRPRVNVISQGFAFCNPTCRAAWWNTPTTDALIPSPDDVASEHPLGATVFHVDPHNCNRAAEITDNDGQPLAYQKGDPVAHYRLDNGDALEAWWRGETEVAEVPLPTVETP